MIVDSSAVLAVVGEEPGHERIGREPLDAYARFAKGRHPAALTFGDCGTYATASIAGEKVLCVGNDLRQADLRLVGWTTETTTTDSADLRSRAESTPARGRRPSAAPGSCRAIVRKAGSASVDFARTLRAGTVSSCQDIGGQPTRRALPLGGLP